MRIMKFGGTSVANAERFATVAWIARDTMGRTQAALVLSAPAGVTNLLVAMVDEAVAGRDIAPRVQQLRAIIDPIVTGLAERAPGMVTDGVGQAVNAIILAIESRLRGVALLGECPPHVAAFVESRGEALSIAIMDSFLRAQGVRTRIIDPVRILAAEGDPLESSVNLDASRERYSREAIPSDCLVLMSGFVGGDAAGRTVLLGRNGSDYSAACLAAVAGAECCEIWTDVDGVYSCDPRIVSDAVLLSRVSYKEAMELSYFGAKVLHPRTIAPIARYHIPCLIKNTANPTAPGTLISSETDPEVAIKGISDLKGISLVNVSGPGMKGMVGMAGRLFTAVSRAQISIVLITQSSSEYSITFCIHSSDVPRARDAISGEFALELAAGKLDPLEITGNCAIISVVGDGMKTMCGTSGRFFRALAQANINVRAIAQGSSERSISAVIPDHKVTEAISVCHMAFFSARQVIDIILVGTGGIGGTLVAQIASQATDLMDNLEVELRIVAAGNSRHFITNPSGLDPRQILPMLESSDEPPFSLERVRRLVTDSHLINPVLVDCTSSEEMASSYPEFMRAGLHVVTPNKKANTLSRAYYRELRRVCRETRRKFLYEANVGAGLPVINTLKNLLAAGDRLISFTGVMSGTISFILGLVEDGMPLSEATRVAYEKGLTEPNPRDDLDGMDVARKLLILAREVGLPMELSDVRVESAVDPALLRGSSAQEFLEALRAGDEAFAGRVARARAEGKVLRYVGTIEDGRCRCALEAVGPEHPLYRVRGGENAFAFTTAYYQPIPLVIRGYGAGTKVTAAGVLSDVLRLQNWTREG
ncbi:MAG: bifunctional aspartate kinase/homoserine dehydrogenase I [Succinivibrionaceae bacterium]|nr:bifunctional aspartate kinase/homoserine dehydrogenase I [Succinivibrionaceae bacterium]